LKLQKALYGLRQSPLLWQRELTSTLKSLGFQAVPQEPCIMKKMVADGLTKAMTADKHQEFVTMIKLVPIESLIRARTQKDLTPEALQALVGLEGLHLGG
jgi:hypothetical protein